MLTASSPSAPDLRAYLAVEEWIDAYLFSLFESEPTLRGCLAGVQLVVTFDASGIPERIERNRRSRRVKPESSRSGAKPQS